MCKDLGLVEVVDKGLALITSMKRYKSRSPEGPINETYVLGIKEYVICKDRISVQGIIIRQAYDNLVNLGSR